MQQSVILLLARHSQFGPKPTARTKNGNHIKLQNSKMNWTIELIYLCLDIHLSSWIAAAQKRQVGIDWILPAVVSDIRWRHCESVSSHNSVISSLVSLDLCDISLLATTRSFHYHHITINELQSNVNVILSKVCSDFAYFVCLGKAYMQIPSAEEFKVSFPHVFIRDSADWKLKFKSNAGLTSPIHSSHLAQRMFYLPPPGTYLRKFKKRPLTICRNL